MKKGNKNNIVYIVISCIVAIVLLALAGVSLYKVINIENDSIPEVISEIDNSKKNTTKLASELQERVNLLDKKIAEEIANLEKVQKDLNSGKEKARMRKISTRIKRILTSNLGLKIVSVLVACMMWIFVVNVDDPEKVQSFSDVKVEIRNSDCYGLDKTFSVLEDTDKVKLCV